MRQWTRTRRDLRCGYCNRRIAAGDPVFQLSIGLLVKIRGVCCAGAAPDDLPPLEPLPRVDARPFVPMRSFADMLPLDYRSRASGEREPGEEG
jgi:hypothetical protein